MDKRVELENRGAIRVARSFQDHPKYRPDIDGLRAIAVLSVVLFHAFPKVFRGGFIGVDIFFVISGFLISSIIFSGLEHSSFSFWDFYARRVRRIVPALCIVLIASLGFGWFYQLSGEFAQLGKHVAAGAGFVSNFILWRESGYFDNAADTKPMLHLWSLGIEEQFYIVWPLLLWAAWKIRLNFLVVSVALACLSFVLNIEASGRDLVMDFYAPQTRVWELMLGAILAYVQLSRARGRLQIKSTIKPYGTEGLGQGNAILCDLQSAAGILLIFVGVFVLHSDSRFPGWWALLPTVGAMLIISAGPTARGNQAILSNRVMVWFGLISFPLYLWHWPILVFSRLMEGGKPPFVSQLLSVCASIALASLTVTFVEKRIRTGKHAELKAGILVVILLVTGGVGYWVYARDGIPQRTWVRPFDSTLSKLQRLKTSSSYDNLYGSRSCFQLPGDRSTEWFAKHGCLTKQYADRPTVFLLGDSHSASLSVGLRPLAEQLRLNFLQMSSGWCPPFGKGDDDQCAAMNRFAMQQIELARPDVLILDAHWLLESDPVYSFKGGGDFFAHLEQLIAGFKRLNVNRVLLIGQIPTWNSGLPDVLARRYVVRGAPIPVRTFVDLNPESLRMDSRMKQVPLPDAASYVSLRDALCDDTGCLTSVGPDLATDLIVWDYGHMTRAGSIFVTDRAIKDPLLNALKGR